MFFCTVLYGFIFILQEKNNLEIDLNYKLKSLQQRLEQEVNEHKITKACLTDKHQSIEEAKSVAMYGKYQFYYFLHDLFLNN